jgi:hypothetical protein
VNATATMVDEKAHIVEFQAGKPAWEVGAATPLKFGKKPAPVTEASKYGVVKLSVAEDDDLIDERTLLQASDLKPAAPVYDCGPSAGAAKKACKNCSCGLAEKQAAEATGATRVVIDPSADDAPKSSCGSVCPSCSMLHLPTAL